MMFFRKKPPSLSTEQIENEVKKADDQVKDARYELSIAKGVASDLRQIRLENNFMNDFRSALGGGNN